MQQRETTELRTLRELFITYSTEGSSHTSCDRNVFHTTTYNCQRRPPNTTRAEQGRQILNYDRRQDCAPGSEGGARRENSNRATLRRLSSATARVNTKQRRATQLTVWYPRATGGFPEGYGSTVSMIVCLSPFWLIFRKRRRDCLCEACR